MTTTNFYVMSGLYCPVVEKRLVGTINVLKVGKSDDPPKRRLQNQDVLKSDMQTLGIVRGATLRDEEAVKRHFKGLLVPKLGSTPLGGRHNREWLLDKSPLRDWVNWFRRLSFVSGEDGWQTAPLPRSDEWLPSGEAYKKHLKKTFSSDCFFPHLSTACETARKKQNGEIRGDCFSNSLWVEAAKLAMGSIDLDPASCRQANDGDGTEENRGVRAARFFDSAENGLEQDWRGNVWLNADWDEYKRGWVKKAEAEWKSGRVKQMCVVIPNRSLGYKYIQHLQGASAIAHLYNPAAGKPWGLRSESYKNFGVSVVYFGDRVEEFRRAFAPICKFVNLVNW